MSRREHTPGYMWHSAKQRFVLQLQFLQNAIIIHHNIKSAE